MVYFFIRNGVKYLDTFTVWSASMVVIFLGLHLINFCFDSRRDSPLWKVITLVYNVAFAWEFTVILLFWTMIFPFIVSEFDNFEVIFSNVVLHILFFGIMVFEVLVNKIEFRKWNYFILVGLSIIYLGVNFFSYKIKGEPIYPMLSYDNLMSIGYVVGALVLITVGFYIGHLITAKYKIEYK